MKNILKKLNHIQTELKAPKGQFNAFGKYKYRSCEDILEGIKPLLKELLCTLTISDKVVLIGDRYYIEATATLYDCESAEAFSNVSSAREEENKKGMDSSQVTGATSSYARKYALNGLLAIDDTKDSDATNNHGKEDTQADMPEEEKIDPNKKIEEAHIVYIKGRLKALDKDLDSFLTYVGVDKLENMTISQFTLKGKPALEGKKK